MSAGCAVVTSENGSVPRPRDRASGSRLAITVARRTGLGCQGDSANPPAVALSVDTENALGRSPLSDPAIVTPVAGNPTIKVPAAPGNVTFAPYENAAQISWDAPTDTGGADITGYTVTAYEVTTSVLDPLTETLTAVGSCTTTSFRDDAVPTTCVITNLDPIVFDPLLIASATYRFGVVATNIVGDGAESSQIGPPLGVFVGGPPPVLAPPVTPVASPNTPAPVVDIEVPGSGSARVEINGHVATPQGRIAIDNPQQHQVHVRGGVVTGSLGAVDSQVGTVNTTVGFANQVVLQRTIEIRSSSSGRAVSTLRVQVNESGTYAVNSWVIQ